MSGYNHGNCERGIRVHPEKRKLLVTDGLTVDFHLFKKYLHIRIKE